MAMIQSEKEQVIKDLKKTKDEIPELQHINEDLTNIIENLRKEYESLKQIEESERKKTLII